MRRFFIFCSSFVWQILLELLKQRVEASYLALQGLDVTGLLHDNLVQHLELPLLVRQCRLQRNHALLQRGGRFVVIHLRERRPLKKVKANSNISSADGSGTACAALLVVATLPKLAARVM